MKTKLIAASLIASFALIGAAQASPNSEPDNTPFQGVYAQNDSNSASRAQVVADLQQARAAGIVAFGDSDNAPYLAQADSGVTRAQVAAQITMPAIAFGDSNNVPFQG
jgi:opacity protein-like surface antigen